MRTIVLFLLFIGGALSGFNHTFYLMGNYDEARN